MPSKDRKSQTDSVKQQLNYILRKENFIIGASSPSDGNVPEISNLRSRIDTLVND